MNNVLGRFDPRDVLLGALAIVTVVYLFVLARGLLRARASERVAPSASFVATGFVANLFDTLGIGSFATTTAIFRHWRLVRDTTAEKTASGPPHPHGERCECQIRPVPNAA